MRRLLSALIVALTLATPAAADANLDVLASHLAGQPVTVSCEDPGGMDGAAGYVWVSSTNDAPDVFDSVIHLDGYLCGWIRVAVRYYVTGPRVQRWAVAMDNPYFIGGALLVLQHEALHVRMQSKDEGVVECAAARNVWNLVHSFAFPRRLEHDVYQGALDLHEAEQGAYRGVC